jgi:hypothetical protein
MICADSEEFKPKTYKGIYVYGCDDEKSKSYTGNPIEDLKVVFEFLDSTNQKAMFSSSLVDFVSDSRKYTFIHDKSGNVKGLKLLKKKKKISKT